MIWRKKLGMSHEVWKSTCRCKLNFQVNDKIGFVVHKVAIHERRGPHAYDDTNVTCEPLKLYTDIVFILHTNSFDVIRLAFSAGLIAWIRFSSEDCVSHKLKYRLWLKLKFFFVPLNDKNFFELAMQRVETWGKRPLVCPSNPC